MRKVPLSTLCKISNGFAFKSDDYVSHGHRVMRITNVQKGLVVDSDPKFVPNEIADKAYNFKLNADDILVSLTGNVGRVGRILKQHLPAVLNQRVGLIRPTSPEINDNYLFQFLNSDQFEREAIQNSNGAAQLNLSTKWIGNYEIPLPPLEDQSRIAHLLGKVEGLIAQRKQHMQLLDDLLKGVFLEMFGDPILNPYGFPIKKLAELYINPKDGTKCGPFGSALKKDELVDSGVPVWNMDNISASGQMVEPFRMWVTPEKYDELRAYSVIDGDIIISRAGTVGKMCVARMGTKPAIISTNLIRLRLGADLRPLHFVSMMLYCKGRVGRLKTGPDGAFTHMNTGVLDSLEFPYPPVELQDRFGDIATMVEHIKSRYKQSLTDLEALYCALSQQVFKGELDLSRVCLPIMLTEKENIEASETLHTPAEQNLDLLNSSEQDLIIHLPDTANLLDAIENIESRKSLLTHWLDAYYGQIAERTFSIQQFMSLAETRIAELHPDTNFVLGSVEYDHIKSWVFKALDDGRLMQIPDVTGHDSDGAPVLGNQVELKALRR